MSTMKKPPTDPAGITSDLDYAIQLLMTGLNDPEFEARIRAESEKIREDVFRERGLLNIAVDLVREGRDEG